MSEISALRPKGRRHTSCGPPDVVIVCVVLVAVLFFQVLSLDSQARSLGASDGGTLKESLKRLQAELATVKEQAPRLGEYMTPIQLHAGKLWFAAKASNWELAEYEPVTQFQKKRASKEDIEA